LLAALQQQVWKPALLDYTINAFEREIRNRLSQMRRESNESVLLRKREQLRGEAQRIAEAIVLTGHSPTLIERLRVTESAIAQLEIQCEQARGVVRELSFDRLRQFVSIMPDGTTDFPSPPTAGLRVSELPKLPLAS
jgi:hypothetical protein